METILGIYRNKLFISELESTIIDDAIEVHLVTPMEIIEDFKVWREAPLSLFSFTKEEQSLIYDFDEVYDNGLSHTQNLIRLLKMFK